MLNVIKPFVKWAGGKGSLLSQINTYYPFELANGQINTYIEPFVGGRSCTYRYFTKISNK